MIGSVIECTSCTSGGTLTFYLASQSPSFFMWVDINDFRHASFAGELVLYIDSYSTLRVRSDFT